LTEFGENRVQEASAKVDDLRVLRPGAPADWHLIGQLQRNKVRATARWAHTVQSVDSVRLATALGTAVHAAQQAGERTTSLRVFIQVKLDDDPGRGGVPLGQLAELAEIIAQTGELHLCGLMAVAPLGEPVKLPFDRLAQASRTLQLAHPEAVEISAGMSGDLEEAIDHGSTCVRVGTALLGGRRLASP
jgi:pyridoxal phosphate enzyme (YggS family)